MDRVDRLEGSSQAIALEAKSSAKNREWLQEHGYLEAAQRLKTEGGSPESMMQKVEALCGVESGVLSFREKDGYVIGASPGADFNYDRFECLLSVAYVAVPDFYYSVALVGKDSTQGARH